MNIWFIIFEESKPMLRATIAPSTADLSKSSAAFVVDAGSKLPGFTGRASPSMLHHVGWTWCIFAQQQSSAPHIWGLLDEGQFVSSLQVFFLGKNIFTLFIAALLSWISTVYCGYLYFLCVPKTHLFIQPVCRKLVSYVTVDVSTEIVELNNTQPFSSRSLLSSFWKSHKWWITVIQNSWVWTMIKQHDYTSNGKFKSGLEFRYNATESLKYI